MAELTERQQQVLDYIIEYKAAHDGAFPTLRRIMAGCGVSSTSEASRLVKKLVEAGRLEYSEGELCVVGARWLRPGLRGISVTPHRGDHWEARLPPARSDRAFPHTEQEGVPGLAGARIVACRMAADRALERRVDDEANDAAA